MVSHWPHLPVVSDRFMFIRSQKNFGHSFFVDISQSASHTNHNESALLPCYGIQLSTANDIIYASNILLLHWPITQDTDTTIVTTCILFQKEMWRGMCQCQTV